MFTAHLRAVRGRWAYFLWERSECWKFTPDHAVLFLLIFQRFVILPWRKYIWDNQSSNLDNESL